MPLFTPCQGKNACVEKGDICITCGRSLDEIARTRQLIDALSELALEMDYSNAEEFATYIGSKVQKKIRYRRENPQ
jgi:hypothetical protein